MVSNCAIPPLSVLSHSLFSGSSKRLSLYDCLSKDCLTKDCLSKDCLIQVDGFYSLLLTAKRLDTEVRPDNGAM